MSEPTVLLSSSDVEFIWRLLPRYVKSGRQRYDHPLLEKLGAIADPGGACLHARRLLDEQRETAIVAAFDRGDALSAIAAEHSVSHQRIQQILARNGRMPSLRLHAPKPDPAWLTPEWREGFARILRERGVLVS